MVTAKTAMRFALLALLGATLASAWAQKIDDVPIAVKNNVPPNFMFMIDNSGSMSNIVPTTPYDEHSTYTSTCSGTKMVPLGASIDISILAGVPRFVSSGVTYRHVTVPWKLSGTADINERCFSNTGIYSARLLGDDRGIPSNYLPADYTGHFLNWYFGIFDGPAAGWVNRKIITSSGSVNTRIEIARASAKAVVDSLPLPPIAGAPAAVRTGLSTYNSGNGGALRVAMSDLTAVSRTTLKTSIDGLSPTGNTPLASTLADIGRYLSTGYNGNITAGTVSGIDIDSFLRQDGTDASPARNSCLSNAPAACNSTTTAIAQRPIQKWCQRSYAFLMTDGRPQADRSFNNNTYLQDYDGDCKGTHASSCVGNGSTSNWDRKTDRKYESQGSDYLDDVAKALHDIDLRPDLTAPAGRTKKNNLLTYVIGFADLQVQNDPLLINTAENGGGLFLSAQDGPTLTQAFKTVVTDALAKDTASAAVAVANAQITVNNTAYVSSYNSGGWFGDFEAFSLDTTTGLPVGAHLWSARDLLDATTPDRRKIASFNGVVGKPFTSTNFTGTPSSLTSGVINYIRGDRTGEGTAYRTRLHLLGDIVNAEAAVVTYAGTTPIIYQPANDGMLHVFDGRVDAGSATRGQELWAYVPRLIHANLNQLASPGYSHHYFVDGTPATAELTNSDVSSPSRILVGGLGKGGIGYYALDITSYDAANETVAASKVKWEFAPTNMGYSFGKPLIVKTAAGWRVIVTSGYGNGTALGGNGQGYVWVLDPADGRVVQTLSTGAGAASDPSGLAHLGVLANTVPDAAVRYVYGGDLKGNVWRFDLDLSTVTKIATLTDGAGNLQPITSAPSVGPVSGSNTKFFVYVGTGRYLSDDDVPGTATANSWATQPQTMYGIADDTVATSAALPNIRGSNGATCPTGGGSGAFVCQSATLSSGIYRASTNVVDLSTRRGWYFDLPVANGRINTDSALTSTGTLAFSVNVPTDVACDPGGSSYFFGINAITGGAVATVTGGNAYHDAGVFVAYSLASRPVIVQTAKGKRALIRLSDKTIANPPVPEPVGMTVPWKRIYWRSLK